MKYYWYKVCPFCNQGRLFIYKDITNSRLYLHCEECEWGWLSPENVDDNVNKFLTLSENFEAIEATAQDILGYGWNKYNFHEVIENY